MSNWLPPECRTKERSLDTSPASTAPTGCGCAPKLVLPDLSTLTGSIIFPSTDTPMSICLPPSPWDGDLGPAGWNSLALDFFTLMGELSACVCRAALCCCHTYTKDRVTTRANKDTPTAMPVIATELGPEDLLAGWAADPSAGALDLEGVGAADTEGSFDTAGSADADAGGSGRGLELGTAAAIGLLEPLADAVTVVLAVPPNVPVALTEPPSVPVALTVMVVVAVIESAMEGDVVAVDETVGLGEGLAAAAMAVTVAVGDTVGVPVGESMAVGESVAVGETAACSLRGGV